MNIKCPSCGTILQCDESMIGQEVSCPKCDKIFTAKAPIKLKLAEDSPESDPKIKHTVSGLYPLKEFPKIKSQSNPQNNHVLNSGHPSWWYDCDFVLLIIIVFSINHYFNLNKIIVNILIIFCVCITIKNIWHHYSFRYVLTTKELKLYTGVIIINEINVQLRDITMVSLQREFYDIIFESATLIVGTSATARTEIKIPHIPKAKFVQQKINEYRSF